jgi:hypothetical protein
MSACINSRAGDIMAWLAGMEVIEGDGPKQRCRSTNILSETVG